MGESATMRYEREPTLHRPCIALRSSLLLSPVALGLAVMMSGAVIGAAGHATLAGLVATSGVVLCAIDLLRSVTGESTY